MIIMNRTSTPLATSYTKTLHSHCLIPPRTTRELEATLPHDRLVALWHALNRLVDLRLPNQGVTQERDPIMVRLEWVRYVGRR